MMKIKYNESLRNENFEINAKAFKLSNSSPFELFFANRPLICSSSKSFHANRSAFQSFSTNHSVFHWCSSTIQGLYHFQVLTFAGVGTHFFYPYSFVIMAQWDTVAIYFLFQILAATKRFFLGDRKLPLSPRTVFQTATTPTPIDLMAIAASNKKCDNNLSGSN